jgi:hypothetical protein
MKKFILIAILLCFSVSISTAQKSKTLAAQTKPAETQIITEIPEAEWKILTAALEAEDWKNSALLAARHLEKLRIDNEKKAARPASLFLSLFSGRKNSRRLQFRNTGRKKFDVERVGHGGWKFRRQGIRSAGATFFARM